MLLLAALSLAAWVFLLFGHGDFWQAGPSLAPARPCTAPPVTIIIPARDEAASIASALKTLLAQTYDGALRLILVDDQSRDGTGEIARALADPRLTVIDGAERPPAWSGKLWALQQGVAAAPDAEFLLFTDADITHDPRHLATLMAQAQTQNLDLVSEMVALNCASWAERALVPAFVYFFAMLYPFDQVNDPGNRTAAAAGGTVLIRAAALTRVGGLAAMRGALIDDVTLAGLVKKTGRIWLGHSQLAASIRPYPHPVDVWRMITRTAYVQLQFSLRRLAVALVGMAVVFVVPPVATFIGGDTASLAGALAWFIMAYSFAPTLKRFGLAIVWAPFLPLAALFYTAATAASAVDHLRGRGSVWKRRSYS